VGSPDKPRPLLDSARRRRKQGNEVANPRIIRLSASDVVAEPDVHPSTESPRQRLGDIAWTLDTSPSVSELEFAPPEAQVSRLPLLAFRPVSSVATASASSTTLPHEPTLRTRHRWRCRQELANVTHDAEIDETDVRLRLHLRRRLGEASERHLDRAGVSAHPTGQRQVSSLPGLDASA
jgi:hypothetical protein